jgi:carboxypeptidase C (cathepsin A)
MTEMAISFNTFLDLFFEVFPERATNEVSQDDLSLDTGDYERLINSQLYIAGESFAGTYIPYIAQQLLQQNKVAGTTKVRFSIGTYMYSSVKNCITYWRNLV